jgi:hypothetical protein
MTQEDWDALKAQMERPWGSMKLRCDQFVLDLHQATDSKNKSWATTVYVDGLFKGEWMRAEKGLPTHEESRRFLRKVSRAFHSKKDIDEWRKLFGKREANKRASEKFIYFDPSWKSFNSLKKHLLANNASITRITDI